MHGVDASSCNRPSLRPDCFVTALIRRIGIRILVGRKTVNPSALFAEAGVQQVVLGRPLVIVQAEMRLPPHHTVVAFRIGDEQKRSAVDM